MRASRETLRRRRWSRGTATVEFAIMAPLLVGILLWSQYFWEVMVTKIKVAEMARFVAFERTVKPNSQGVVAEAENRYRDLDGTTLNVNAPVSMKNGFTITSVTSDDVRAPWSNPTDIKQAGQVAGGAVTAILNAVLALTGNASEKILNKMGFDTNTGAVRVKVTATIQNRLVPNIPLFTQLSGDAGVADLTLTENFYMFHDTWRAWDVGSDPNQTYPVVEEKVKDRVASGVFLFGLANKIGGVLSSIGAVLNALNLDFPLDTSFAKRSVVINKPTDNGRFSSWNAQTRTTPGDKLQAILFTGYTGGANANSYSSAVKERAGYTTSGVYSRWNQNAYVNAGKDNFQMRAYNCRGQFFQGQQKSGAYNGREEGMWANDSTGAIFFAQSNTGCMQ